MTAQRTQEELAVRAADLWRAADPAGAPPTRVEKLKRGWRSSAVLRLVGAGPRGRSVIAKCAERRSIEREAYVYREVLERLGATAPRCLAVVADGGEAWLFLEDAGEDRFQSSRSGHRRLAARWMARVHGGARLLPLAALPERGANHYRALLSGVERLLRGALANPAMRPDDAATVEVLLERVRAIEMGWMGIADVLAETPETIALGGFSGKNARVRMSADGAVLLPFDFESAGYGAPAIDLVHVDGDAYMEEADGWWGLGPGEFDRVQETGRLLGVLKAIPGERRGLLGSSPAGTVARLSWYAPILDAGAVTA